MAKRPRIIFGPVEPPVTLTLVSDTGNEYSIPSTARRASAAFARHTGRVIERLTRAGTPTVPAVLIALMHASYSIRTDR